MPSFTELKENVDAEILELRKKIQLSEGQGKAFYEESESEKKSNREAISSGRSGIKELHIRLHEAKLGSERAVEDVIHSRKRTGSSSAPGSAKVKKSDDALKISEYKLHDYVKRLNYLEHLIKQKEDRLESLHKQLLESGPDRAKEEQVAIQNLKEDHIKLENELDRILVQVSESEGIRRHYVAMATSLRGEAASHRTNLDTFMSKLTQQKDALKDLKDSRRSAERTRDGLRQRLHQEEDFAFECRRERERKLEEYRNKVDEKGLSYRKSKSERKISLARTPAQRTSPTLLEGESDRGNRDMNRFFHLFSKLKDVMGVTSISEVMERLKTQAGTREHLHSLRDSTLADLDHLKKKKEDLQEELHRVKYSATEDSAKLEGAFDELVKQKSLLEEKIVELNEQLEDFLKVLAGIRAALEHVAEKLQTYDGLKPEKGSESLQDYLLCLMNYCINQAQVFLRIIEEKKEEIEMENVEKEIKEMRVFDFAVESEKDSPTHQTAENARIGFVIQGGKTKPSGQQPDEATDSGEEEEAMMRRFIKRQAQSIVEAKSRKRNRPVASTFRS